VFRFKIVGIGRRPMLIQRGMDLFLLHRLFWLWFGSHVQPPLCSSLVHLCFGTKPETPLLATGSEPLSDLNSIDFVERVLRKAPDVES
jgi:hypothetical protein